MNRIIKFRAWDEDLKQMMPAVDLSAPKSQHKWLGVKDIIIMQYTGLNDKNGKEIYEGDVVRCYHDEDMKSVFVIKDFIYDVWTMSQEIEHVQMEWEILGNIYENPELLKN
jgi:hypothetical protein